MEAVGISLIRILSPLPLQPEINLERRFVMKITIVFVAVLCMPALAFSDTINVPVDYPTIQEGIDAAVDGDTVLVAKGSYVENIDFKGKDITVRSKSGSDYTSINGGAPVDPDFGSVVTFKNGEPATTVLEGFTLYKGTGTYHLIDRIEQWMFCGGGLFCMNASPTIRDCIIFANSAQQGGGGFIEAASPEFDACRFSSNAAIGNNGNGGGMNINELSAPFLRNCTFAGNFADHGGGLYCYNLETWTMIDSVFFMNLASIGGGICILQSPLAMDRCLFEENASLGHGGAIYNETFHEPCLTACTFRRNSADFGGGIFNFYNSEMTVAASVFEGNWANFNGGGVFNWFDAKMEFSRCHFKDNEAEYGGGICNSFHARAKLENCLFTGNQAFTGGALYNAVQDESVTVTNCSFHKNYAFLEGGAITNVYSDLFITNSVLWSDSAGTPPVSSEIVPLSGSVPDVTYCDVQGGYPGTGNIDFDPLFVDASNGDLHLLYGSPCRDAGDNAAVMEALDFEGDPRIHDGTVDMGADEFHPHLYVTGIMILGGTVDGKLIGYPGTSPVGLFLGSGVLEPPMPTAWGNFHLQSPWFMIPLVPIPSNSVLVLPATIPATPPAPYDLPMQALIGLNPDSLTNLYVLEVR
jgi:hypothetical protein